MVALIVLYMSENIRGYYHVTRESVYMRFSNILNTTGLFDGIDSELESLLRCMGAETRNVAAGEILLLAGDKPESIGIVLSGRLHILREDYDGNRSLMAAAMPGDLYAEALCCAGVPESPVTVMADTDAVIMRLDFARIMRVCPNACLFHSKLIENMLKLVAEKNLQLQGRMEILCQKSIRARVMRYLESLVPHQGRQITIPFNREELADFLAVERSALSHELSRMKRDGLLDYRKNWFMLKG